MPFDLIQRYKFHSRLVAILREDTPNLLSRAASIDRALGSRELEHHGCILIHSSSIIEVDAQPYVGPPLLDSGSLTTRGEKPSAKLHYYFWWWIISCSLLWGDSSLFRNSKHGDSSLFRNNSKNRSYEALYYMKQLTPGIHTYCDINNAITLY